MKRVMRRHIVAAKVAVALAKGGKQAIVKIDQITERRWLLTVACGHEVWMTSDRRPRVKTIICSKCSTKGEGS